VFAVKGAGFGMAEMQGAGDMLLLADPPTFRVLPRVDNTGLGAVPTSTSTPTAVSRVAHSRPRALRPEPIDRLAEAGYDFMAGLEVEFHILKLRRSEARPRRCRQPRTPAEVQLLTQGYRT